MTSYHGHRTSQASRRPALKRLTQSATNSLDLDRSAEQQDAFGAFGIYGNGTGNWSSHDVSVNQAGGRAYHARSTSGTSQFSTGSGGRSVSFVHPFQQTPRPYTPPLETPATYQTSLREGEQSQQSRTNSPAALTEDEDQRRQFFRTNSSPSNRTHSFSGNTSPIVGSHPLRLQNRRTSSSRLWLTSSHTSLEDTLAFSPEISSPVASAIEDETMSPASAIRSSMEKGFRIRSRSEIGTRMRAESIQEERRKFHEKELAKDEKVAREEIRLLEKRNEKEARAIERQHRHSSASDAARNKRSKSDLNIHDKDAFLGREYSSVSGNRPPFDQDEDSEEPPRSYTGLSGVKYKTHGFFTSAGIWVRSSLLRIGSKKKENA